MLVVQSVVPIAFIVGCFYLMFCIYDLARNGGYQGEYPAAVFLLLSLTACIVAMAVQLGRVWQ